MTLAPDISIITITLDSERTITRAIESVLSQSFRNFEYLIIDGGSADRTLQICESFQDSRMHIYSGKDLGISDAMNRGIAKARGRLIGLIHSDDMYFPGAIERAWNSITNPDQPAWCYGILEYISPSGKLMHFAGDSTGARSIRRYMATPHPTVFMTRSLYDRIGLFALNLKVAMDYDVCLRASLVCKPIFVDSVQAIMQVGGLSSRSYKHELTGALEVMKSKIKHIPDRSFLHRTYWLWMSSKIIIRAWLFRYKGLRNSFYSLKRSLFLKQAIKLDGTRSEILAREQR